MFHFRSKEQEYIGVLFTEDNSFTVISVQDGLKNGILNFKSDEKLDILYPDKQWYSAQVLSAGSKS